MIGNVCAWQDAACKEQPRPRDIYVRYPEVLQEGVFLGPDVKILLGTKVAKC